MGPEDIVTENELYYMDADTRSVIKLDGIKTVNEARSEIGLDPVEDIIPYVKNEMRMALDKEIKLTGSFQDDNEVIFDLVHPVKCNCRNCGAPVRLEYCEYCGTPYPTDYKLGMKWENK